MYIALIFRVILLLFSLWQDTTRWPDGQLRFTDVDYDVFTDAARALVSGQDIYEARPTYRYSPLIASIIAPGHWIFHKQTRAPPMPSSAFFDPPLEATRTNIRHHSTDEANKNVLNLHDILSRLWGKLVFVAADLLCAWLQYRIITTELKPNSDTGSGAFLSKEISELSVQLVSFCWLFNPVTAVVSVRGNVEAVLGVCILGSLALLLQRRLFLAGITFGLCIHLKLYPVIYSPAVYLWLSRWSEKPTGSFLSRLARLIPSRDHFKFACGTLLSLVLLTGYGYLYFGGMKFLHQAYLYHFTRVDMKHNFAPHFYPFYLLSGLRWKMLDMQTFTGLLKYGATRELLFRQLSAWMGLHDPTVPDNLITWALTQCVLNADVVERVFNVIAMLHALLLIPGLSFKLSDNLGLCWFAITYAFVTFNKVCTSQYFLWSLVLLPIALAQIQLPPNRSVIGTSFETLLLWLAPQALWLASAYTLEMRTPESEFMARWVWILVWSASLIFLCSNVFLLRRLIKWRKINTSDFASAGRTTDNSGATKEDKKTR